MRVVIALLGGLFFCVEAAVASNWVYLTDTDNALIFIDTESIAMRDGKVKAWFLFEYGGPQTDASKKRKYLSSKQLAYFDCAERTVAFIQDIRYEKESGKGDVVNSYSIPITKASFDDIAPDTFGESMHSFVCPVAGR